MTGAPPLPSEIVVWLRLTAVSALRSADPAHRSREGVPRIPARGRWTPAQARKERELIGFAWHPAEPLPDLARRPGRHVHKASAPAARARLSSAPGGSASRLPETTRCRESALQD